MINRRLYTYRARHGITFTRGRAWNNNDSAARGGIRKDKTATNSANECPHHRAANQTSAMPVTTLSTAESERSVRVVGIPPVKTTEPWSKRP